MTTVSTRTLKDQLSSYLRRAEGGERIVVTRGKKVVAAIVPCKETEPQDEDARLRHVEAQGGVVLPQEDAPPLRFQDPRIPSRNRSASAMVLEDRR